MKLDILAFGAHPDDVELSCGGTVIKAVKAGKKVGVIDLTEGELGTRGTAATRKAEAEAAKKILGLSARENLGFADGFFLNDKEHQIAIIKVLRKYQPEIVLLNAIYDRHPDHGKGATLVSDACFLSGLVKIDTQQEPWRPKFIYHYIQDREMDPSFVVDISAYIAQKMEAIKAYKTQFFDPNSEEPETYISKPGFLDAIRSRAANMGHKIGVAFGEGFVAQRTIGISDIDLFI